MDSCQVFRQLASQSSTASKLSVNNNHKVKSSKDNDERRYSIAPLIVVMSYCIVIRPNSVKDVSLV